VNTALREYAARHRRVEALETYATLSQRWDYEGWERRRQADKESFWRVLRSVELREAWGEVITSGAVGSCPPPRAEFRRSARDIDEYDQMSAMFDTLHPDVSVPKDTWRWIEAASTAVRQPITARRHEAGDEGTVSFAAGLDDAHPAGQDERRIARVPTARPRTATASDDTTAASTVDAGNSPLKRARSASTT
jgi:hypothetical protein